PVVVPSDTTFVASIPPRVLIVDDERASREALRQLLVEEGFVVETACDVAQAFTRLPTFLPDVLVTDLAMPGLAAGELIRGLREEGVDASIIFTSGYAYDDEIVVSLQKELGGLYVQKPIDFEWFILTLRSLLRDRERTRPDDVSAAKVPQS